MANTDEKLSSRAKALLFSSLELLRREARPKFSDWKDADDWLFSELDFTKDELAQIYEGRGVSYYAASAADTKTRQIGEDVEYPYDFGNGYKVQTKYANMNSDGGVGDIYDFASEVEHAHPGAEILTVYCVVAEALGLVPDRCNDWNASVADTVRDYEEHVLPFLERPSKEALGVRWFTLDESHCVSVWYSPDKHDGDQFQMHLELRKEDGSMGPGCEVLSDESYATNDISYSALVDTLLDVHNDASIVSYIGLDALASNIYTTFLPEREWFVALDDIDRDCVEQYEYLLGRELTGYKEYSEIDAQVDGMILEWEAPEAFFAEYPELKKYTHSMEPEAPAPSCRSLDAQIQSASNRISGREDQPEAKLHAHER